MKKLLLLFLLISTTISYGQTTLANKLKITGNTTSTTATKVNVQENDGTINTKPISELVNYLEFASAVNLPVTGEQGKLYLTKDNNKIYRWNGTFYQELTTDETTETIQAKRPLKTIENQSLEGSGNIDLSKSDVGLGNVDNTSDANKPISTATQTALNGKENSFTKNTAFNKNFGTTAGTVVEGNDSRILNGQTAFSWGNHAGLYPTLTGTGATGTWGINISGNAANSTLWNGYDISVAPTDVAPSGILGFYNSGVTFRRSSATALSSFLGLGSNAYTSTDYFKYETFTADANTLPGNRSAFTYAINAPHTGTLVHFGAVGYGTQINTNSSNGDSFSFRTSNGDILAWNPWRKMWHDGNFNPANYLPLSGGTLSGALNGTSATFSGSVTASGGFFNSDRRLKNIFKRDGDVAYYTWKDGRDTKEHIGYVAQEVQEKHPNQVQADEKGMLSVNYVEILVEKIRILEKRIEQLEKSK